MLVHMTNTADGAPQNDDRKKYSKPGTFDKMFCKTGKNEVGLTRITLQSIPLVVTTKENMQLSLRRSSTNRHTPLTNDTLKEKKHLIFIKWHRISVVSSKKPSLDVQ